LVVFLRLPQVFAVVFSFCQLLVLRVSSTDYLNTLLIIYSDSGDQKKLTLVGYLLNYLFLLPNKFSPPLPTSVGQRTWLPIFFTHALALPRPHTPPSPLPFPSPPPLPPRHRCPVAGCRPSSPTPAPHSLSARARRPPQQGRS